MNSIPKSEPQLTGQNATEPFPGAGGVAAIDQSGKRFRQTLKDYDKKGEIFIALCQIATAGLIFLFYIIDQTISGSYQASIDNIAASEEYGWSSENYFLVIALLSLSILSVFRIYMVLSGTMTDRFMDFLTVIDILCALLIIFGNEYIHNHSLEESLKSPLFVILYVFIAIRTMRFNPRPVLVSGIAAAAGWTFMVLLSVALDGTDAVARNYTDYLASPKILISAEFEKIIAILALTGCLAYANRQVRTFISKAAHGEDYAEALKQSEQNVKNAMAAHLQTEETMRQLLKNKRQLTVQNDQFNALLKNMSQGISMWDSNRHLILCNDRFSEICKLNEELIRPGTLLRDMIAHWINNGFYFGAKEEFIREYISIARERKTVSKIYKMHDGRTFAFVFVPLAEGGALVSFEDISELRQVQEDYYHLAHHDTLTGLANRHDFVLQLEKALAQIRPGESIAVQLIDLDYFKNVNDTLGHPIGDKLLQEVTKRLRCELGELDFVARMGGDEFALIQFARNQPAEAEDLANRVINSVSEPYVIDDHQVVIGASIGIAIAPGDGDLRETIMRNADLALYQAKDRGRGTYSLFEAHMDAKMQARSALELDLRNAIEKGEFELHYQPLVDLESEELCGFEALIRWPHPEKGNIPPAEFIPLAEETGYIVPIGEWVIREACKTAASWPEHLHISINLSAVQFRDHGLVQLVVNALGYSGLAPGRLELEITESVLLENSKATLDTLHQLKQLGVRIAMDDFGTGYSSLSYLQSFPFDRIKIDRSFIEELASGGTALNIVRAVSAMAKGMGIATTAEGVETEQQLDMVRDEGYSQIQGYYISKPLPADEIREKFLSNVCVKPKNRDQENPESGKMKIVVSG